MQPDFTSAANPMQESVGFTRDNQALLAMTVPLIKHTVFVILMLLAGVAQAEEIVLSAGDPTPSVAAKLEKIAVDLTGGIALVRGAPTKGLVWELKNFDLVVWLHSN